MMPEPTTAARRNAVPNHSQNARCGSAGISSALLPSPLRLHAADLREPLLQTDLIEASDRQRRENPNMLMEHPVRILEGKGDLSGGAFGFGRIGNAPMRRHRLAGPHWAGLASGVVADGEGKIERRRARLGELVPTRRVIAETLQELDGVRVHSTLRVGSPHCKHGI